MANIASAMPSGGGAGDATVISAEAIAEGVDAVLAHLDSQADDEIGLIWFYP